MLERRSAYLPDTTYSLADLRRYARANGYSDEASALDRWIKVRRRRRVENAALVAIAVGSLAGIAVIQHAASNTGGKP